MDGLLLYLSLDFVENEKRYADYVKMSDSGKKEFAKKQFQETGLYPEQVYSIIHAPAIPISSTVGNKQKRVYLRDIYAEIYKNDISAISVTVNALSCLDSPFLSDAWGDVYERTGEIIPLTLRSLATDHIRRILDADLSFPIITINNKTVLDGWHRVAKAYYLGQPTILSFDISESHWRQVPSVPGHGLK